MTLIYFSGNRILGHSGVLLGAKVLGPSWFVVSVIVYLVSTVLYT